MCMLMFYVTEIDGVEGQWVAQLCGCKASSPLSACQKTEACQQLCVCVSPSVCVFVHYRVYICVQAQCANTGLCVCLTWRQPGPLPTAQREPSFPSMWHLLATGKYRTRWGRDWCMVATRCVCVCLFVFVCAICVKTNLSHMYSFTLWIYECLSRHLCVHACITAMSMLDPKELTGPFGMGLKKRERWKREGSPRHFNCCLTDKWT